MSEKSTAIGWGKPTPNIGRLGVGGTAPSIFKRIPTPVENSTKLTPTKGKKMEAKIEGGANEGVKYAANTYVFEFEIRKTEAKDMPVEDFDGLVGGEFCIQLIPEDVTALGFIIDRASASVEDTYDAENGPKLKFTFDVLKPIEGKQVKWGVQVDKCPTTPALEVTPTVLSFGAAADATGQTLTVASTGAITSAKAPADMDWVTVTKTGKTAKVKVTANANSEARSCTVTITADDKAVNVLMVQAGASA